MLEDRPILKDRLTAGAVFSGIAIAAVAGFELIITGGFDVITLGVGETDRSAPSAHGAVLTPWAADAYPVTPTPAPAAPLNGEAAAYPVTDEPLAGAGDASEADGVLNDSDLAAEIEALYRQSAAYVAEAAPDAGEDFKLQ